MSQVLMKMKMRKMEHEEFRSTRHKHPQMLCCPAVPSVPITPMPVVAVAAREALHAAGWRMLSNRICFQTLVFHPALSSTVLAQADPYASDVSGLQEAMTNRLQTSNKGASSATIHPLPASKANLVAGYVQQLQEPTCGPCACCPRARARSSQPSRVSRGLV